MRSRFSGLHWVLAIAVLAGSPAARASSLTYSHATSALPGAAGPAITLLSASGNNNGSDYIFTLAFANPTIDGPSSGNNNSVYGFINLDADNNPATGVTGAFLDANSYEPGFGRYTPSSLGIDAVINLSSEGDPLHGSPGLVDVVAARGFTPVATASVTYSDQVGSTPSMLSISIPLTDFTTNQISLLNTGNFSVVVGNANNATDFLGPAAAAPEPGSAFLLAAGVSLAALAAARFRGAVRSRRREPSA